MAHSAMSTYWPLFDLVVRTPRLELRVPDDDIACELARVAAEGIHDPAFMPFAIAWTDVPSPQQERNSLQHYWMMRAQWKPDDWHLGLAVLVDGAPVGMQGANATNFAKTAVASTGSWLSQRVQGQGFGKEMRRAVLELLFSGLGARRCESGAYEDNAPSLAVSRALGYEENGDKVELRRGEPARQIRLVLSRERWEAHRPSFEITIDNLAPCREMFGLPAGG